MSLIKLVDNDRTDKNTVHSYLPLYENLLSSKKGTAKNVLEIGIQKGGSIKLWHDYFTNAHVVGLDVMHITEIWSGIKNNDRITLYSSTDAYNLDFIKTELIDKPVRFDMVLDDGPHTLNSMKTFVKMYSQLLTDDGILILEDVASIDWIPELKKQVPDNLKQFIAVYDLRANKGRYDDIVFVINKRVLP